MFSTTFLDGPGILLVHLGLNYMRSGNLWPQKRFFLRTTTKMDDFFPGEVTQCRKTQIQDHLAFNTIHLMR